MQLTPVTSSNLAAVGYDAIGNVLHVQFIGKEKVYKYYGVPVEVHAEMMATESKGSYYFKNIKNKYKDHPPDENVGEPIAEND